MLKLNFFESVNYFWIKWLIVFFVISYHSTVSAQLNEDEPVDNIIKLLKEELKNSGQNIAHLKFGTTPGANDFTLNKIPASNSLAYGLDKTTGGAFYINATTKNVTIVSTSTEGLRNGVYWYLQWLGFRFYFPGEIWTYSPELKTIFKPVERMVSPSFSHRRIWYAYGTGSDQADKDYKKWAASNLLGGEEVNAGHSYEAIVNRNKAVFLQHPEYFAQKVEKGKIPGGPKFDVANDDLVQLVINDALEQIESQRKKTGKIPSMISMDPSDGGGFSTTASSLKIGGPSEQTFYLANKVAKAVKARYPGVKIGLYAYNLHAAPPRFELEPNIVVLVATAMNQSAFRTDELIEAWKKKGAEVGIRDYFGVMAWDWDMPGKVRGGKFDYVEQIKKYHKWGARFFSAETNIGWISRGLGHYMGAQLLWNVETDIETIEKDFYKNMFGRAARDVERLFDSWQKYSEPLPLDGDLYQWGKWMDAASKAESEKKIQQRIDYIKQYLHYVYLFKRWREKNSDANLIELLNYAYRLQNTGIVASYPLFRRLANAAVNGKQNMRFNDPKALWKRNNKPVSSEETEQNLRADLGSLNASEKTVDFQLPDRFQQKTLTRGIKSSEDISPQTSLPIRLRGGHKIVFQLGEGNAAINLSAGLIKTKNFKTLRLAVYHYNKELSTEGEALLTETIQPKQPLKAISLNSLKAGSYIAIIDDAKNGFTMSFTGAVSYAIVAGNQNRIWTFARNNLVFSVKEINEFQIKNDGALTLLSPVGRVIDLQGKRGVFTIQVQKGEQGFWKVKNQSGVFNITGIVPFVSPDQAFLLRIEE